MPPRIDRAAKMTWFNEARASHPAAHRHSVFFFAVSNSNVTESSARVPALGIRVFVTYIVYTYIICIYTAGFGGHKQYTRTLSIKLTRLFRRTRKFRIRPSQSLSFLAPNPSRSIGRYFAKKSAVEIRS